MRRWLRNIDWSDLAFSAVILGVLFLATSVSVVHPPSQNGAVAQTDHSQLAQNNRCCETQPASNPAASDKKTVGQPTGCPTCCQCCEERKHPAPFTWDWFFDSPVSMFTGLLVAVGAMQAFFLWGALGESRHSSQIASAALIATNRPYVHVKGFIPTPAMVEGNIVGWNVVAIWENTGNTPAINARTSANWVVFNGEMPENFDFPDRHGPGAVTLIGPHSFIYSGVMTLNIEHILAVAASTQHIYIYGWFEYDDTFPESRRHRTEFCNHLVMRGDPRIMQPMPLEFTVYERHNGAT